MKQVLDELSRRRSTASLGGGASRRSTSELTARERIELLFKRDRIR